MAGRSDTKSKVSGHSGVSVDTPIYLKTGPVRIKPVQNIMFELDTTCTRAQIGSPKIDQVNTKAIGLAPLNIGHINCQKVGKATTNIVSTSHEAVGAADLSKEHLSSQEAGKVLTNSSSITNQAVGQPPVKMDHTKRQAVDKATTKSESLHRQRQGPNSSDHHNKNDFPRSMSLGSFTIAQLASDGVEATRIEPKYNAGVLQGNWFDERKHPKYRPIHPPPLNTCNLEYRSTYKDAFLNHNLKDVSSVRPKKKDNSLPAWFVDDEVKKTSPRSRPYASKDDVEEHVRERCDGKDPHKGHDMDPFKRRDEYKTGYEYKLDAFQENPSLWDKYRGRETYFKMKDHGNGYRSHNTEAGDGRISANHRDDPQGKQRENQTPESLVADEAQAHEGGRMVNTSHDKPHAPEMGRHDKSHAPDVGHMGIVHQLEEDPKKLTRPISTEYKSNFKPIESMTVMSVAKRRRERERVFAAARNISTFAF